MASKAGAGSGTGPRVMRRPATAVAGIRGVEVCRQAFDNQFGWIFRELDQRDDFGIDAWVEVVGSGIDGEHVTGRLIAVQIKDGSSFFDGKETDEGWRFNADLEHLNYWLGYSLPVLVVLVTPDGDAYWQLVTNHTVTEYKKGFRLDIPRTNTLDLSAKEALTSVAWNQIWLIESLPADYAVLPSDAVGPLKRAEALDQLGAARLANRLAQGRGQPGLTVSGLLKLSPAWVAESPAAQELWMAVGGYAVEHDLPADVCHKAQARAAHAGGDNPARAHAFAGLALAFSPDADERDDARSHLEAARDGGQILLADFGLAVLDVPYDSAPSIAVPESIATASTAVLDREPTVLNFLGENAKRRGDLDEAIEFRRRAHTHAFPGSGIELELARDLIQRATNEGLHAGRDAREALSHAQAVAVERRRWSGPSGEAVAVATSVLMMTDNPEQAIAESTSSLDGGKAEPRETVDRGLIRAGASAALLTRDDEALERYLSVLEDTDVLARQVRAHRADLERDQAGHVAAIGDWEKIADDAAAADEREILAVAVAHLAHVGVWSVHADYLIDHHLLPKTVQKILRAVWQTHHDRDAGLAELRGLAESNPHAALELVEALKNDPDEALAESAIQLEQWHTTALAEQRVMLLRDIGDVAAAEGLARGCIDDGAYSIGARQNAARSLGRRHISAERLDDASEALLAGLGLSDDDDDLAWMYVEVLHRKGDFAGARKAVVRYQVRPVTDREADLWIDLHVGDDDGIAPDPRVLLEIVERLPRGRYRNWVRSLVLHETLTPSGPKEGLPADVLDAIRVLADEANIDPDHPSLTLPVTPPERPDPTEYRKLVVSARLGRTPLAEIASWCDRPYTSALLDSPTSVLAAADAEEEMRQFGRATAKAVIKHPGWLVDLSTLAVLSHLDPVDVEVILVQVPTLTLTASASADIATALEELRGLPAAYRLSNSSGGVITGSRIDPRRVADLTRSTQRMNELAQAMAVAPVASHSTSEETTKDSGPLEQAIHASAASGMPLWCDDRAARQRARSRRVTCFGTVDLIESLEPGNLREHLLTLARARVIDLPLTEDELITLAGEGDWTDGPAHTALASAGTWAAAGASWKALWQSIAEAAAGEGFEALTLVTQAALMGVLNNGSSEQAPRRYLELVAIGLVECHQRGVGAEGFLEAVAEQFNSRVVPDVNTVRLVLAGALADAGVAAAPVVACEVLGVDFVP